MSNQLKFTLYLDHSSLDTWKEACIATCTQYSATLFQEYETEPIYTPEASQIGWRLTLFVVQEDQAAFNLMTSLDQSYPLNPTFLDLISDLISRLPVESVCISYGFDLEADPGLTRYQLENFDFQSYAGIGLLPAAASWFQAYLEGSQLGIYQRQAGDIRLFLSPTLCLVLGIVTQIEMNAKELFIPWLSPAPEAIIQLWLENLSIEKPNNLFQPEQIADTWRFFHNREPDVSLASQAQEILLQSGWTIKPIPETVAIQALSFKAHPEEARKALGDLVYEQFIDLSQTLLTVPYQEIEATRLQQLELLVFGMINYSRESDKSELLISRCQNVLSIYLVSPRLKENNLSMIHELLAIIDEDNF